uniref:non-specific serine/threonine protein kinase n=1 Tax=Amphiprion ocellaris TaxID=80972 RepID=A0AAQ5Y8R6_AMPOC
VVMELCENRDLLNYISVRGALKESSSCRLFKQLCKALQYLHNMDVGHRDLKCENLLLDKHSNLKVCDFEFSKRLSYVDGQMALSETYCGTSSYAAPEILKNFPYNPKVSNVWSMAQLYLPLAAYHLLGLNQFQCEWTKNTAHVLCKMWHLLQAGRFTYIYQIW